MIFGFRFLYIPSGEISFQPFHLATIVKPLRGMASIDHQLPTALYFALCTLDFGLCAVPMGLSFVRHDFLPGTYVPGYCLSSLTGLCIAVALLHSPDSPSGATVVPDGT
jgi:hypothetical protein